MNNLYKVFLPEWVFKEEDEKQIFKNAEQYLLRYPHYCLRKVEGRFAVCRRKFNSEGS